MYYSTIVYYAIKILGKKPMNVHFVLYIRQAVEFFATMYNKRTYCKQENVP